MSPISVWLISPQPTILFCYPMLTMSRLSRFTPGFPLPDAIPSADDLEGADAEDLTLWQRLLRKPRREWFRLVAKGSGALFIYFLLIGLCSALFGAVVGSALMIITFLGMLLRFCLKLLGPSSSL